MAESVNDVQKTIEQAKDALTVKRVFGDPIEKNGVTIIPAARVQGGGGGGTGEGPGGEGKGSGSGFGVNAKPAGAYVMPRRRGRVASGRRPEQGDRRCGDHGGRGAPGRPHRDQGPRVLTTGGRGPSSRYEVDGTPMQRPSISSGSGSVMERVNHSTTEGMRL